MDRLEFTGAPTIPVAKNDGPFSALFDYRAEEAKANALNEKKQKVQQKIMRTNALGEAFRILGEGIAANKGAPVTPRNPNPFILNAVNEYAKSDLDYINKLEGISAKKLALGQMDVQYKKSTEAAAAERKHQEYMQAQKELNDFIAASKLQEQQFKLRGLENEAEAARQAGLKAMEYLQELDIAQKKAQWERGINLIPGQGFTTGVDILTPPAKGDNKTLQFVTPDTKQTIYLGPGLINYIATQLSVGKGKYDYTVPQALRDFIANKDVKPASMAKVFTDNWEWIKENIFLPAPDLAAQLGINAAEPQNFVEVRNDGNQQGNYNIPGLNLNQQGTESPDTAGTEQGDPNAYKKQIFSNLTNDTSLDLEDNKAVRKKIEELTDIIYADYLKRPGKKLSRNEAVTEANQIVHNYRKLKKQVLSKPS